MNLEQAVATAGKLRDALTEEVESARGERQLLRRLDTQGLFGRAAQRTAFLGRVQQLEAELAQHLARAGVALGLAEVTIDGLRRHGGAAGERLGRTLSEIRALAGALAEIDRLNKSLAQRALSCVRGYVDALAPAPRAYDRRGLRAASAPSLATVSSKG